MTDAAPTFTHDIQTAWNKGLVTLALTIDIKEYFDFVNHKKLLTKMRQANLPLPMGKWMVSFCNNLVSCRWRMMMIARLIDKNT
jgi:hypothetical protein